MLRRDRGFTFIELMIVVAIIGIISVVAIPNYSRFRQRQNLRSCASQISADLRLANAEALKTEQYVWLKFYTDSENGSLFYRIIRDVDDNGSYTHPYDEQNGTISEFHPTRVFTNSRIGGQGVADGAKLTFNRGGEVDSDNTDLTHYTSGEEGYYSIVLSPTGSETATDAFEVRIYDGGRVEDSRFHPED